MSLYNDLTTVLTPYANKIKRNESDIGDIQDTLEHLDVETDKTLSVDGKPADAKAVGDEIADLKSDLKQKTGLSEDAKIALLDCFEHVAWIDEHGQTYYDNLYDALYPDTGLDHITTVFEQGSYVVYPSTPLNDLKPYLTVTGYYKDGSTARLVDYALSGVLTVGTSMVTVTKDGKTATFNVTVSEEQAVLQSITAVFNQGSVVIYTDSSLNDLKPYLTVTARYSDGTTQTVTNYTLSGTLTAGTSTITVSYGGKTTQFTVNVSSSNVLHYPGDNIYLYKQSTIDPNSTIGYGLVYSYTSQKVTFVSTVGDYPIYDAQAKQPMQYYPISIPSEANGITITPTVSGDYKLRALAREFSDNRYGEVVADTKWQSNVPVALDLTNAGNNPKYLLITMQGGTSATIGTIDVDALEIEFTV